MNKRGILQAMQEAEKRMLASKQLLEACEDAYTHIAITCQALGELCNESDARILEQLEQAIRAAGGKVIGANGKEVK